MKPPLGRRHRWRLGAGRTRARAVRSPGRLAPPPTRRPSGSPAWGRGQNRQTKQGAAARPLPRTRAPEAEMRHRGGRRRRRVASGAPPADGGGAGRGGRGCRGRRGTAVSSGLGGGSRGRRRSPAPVSDTPRPPFSANGVGGSGGPGAVGDREFRGAGVSKGRAFWGTGSSGGRGL